MSRQLFFCFFIFVLVLGSFVSAHEEESAYNTDGQNRLYYQTRTLSMKLLISATIIITAFVAYAIANNHSGLTHNKKKILFLGIAVPALIATIVLAYATVYLNVVSETKGPVHWHADFEIWNCGEKIDLKNPEGFTNRIGTPVFHEHSDDRIHVEGVLIDKSDANLGRFFNVTSGLLTQEKMRVPTNTGFVEATNGESCNGVPAKLQVFLFHVTNPEQDKEWVYEQKKIEHFDDYVLAPQSLVPPGDCIIVEFGPEKEKTTNLCETYRIAESRGELRGR
ncbi:MAG: hypothetical protein Q7R76_02485 [Candidatus Woesearchaeota archaeon]|nr:hypothetical protein [Candidatus Woesearchaeota archaeon]